MTDTGVFDEGHISEVEVELDLTTIKNRLLADPDFVNQLRALLLKDARKLGNSLGQYAQATNPTAANPVRRIQ